MSYGVGHIRSSDPVLLWLWCRPAVVPLIRPLAWEPPNAVSAALKGQKTKKKKKKNTNNFLQGNGENVNTMCVSDKKRLLFRCERVLSSLFFPSEFLSFQDPVQSVYRWNKGKNTPVLGHPDDGRGASPGRTTCLLGHSQSSSVWSLAFNFSIFLSSRNSVLSFFSVPVPSSFFSSIVSWIKEYSS